MEWASRFTRYQSGQHESPRCIHHGQHDAYECIRSLAADHGVEVCGSELVGLAPLSSFLNAGRWYHQTPDKATEQDLVDAAVKGLGLDSMGAFVPEERIIEYAAEVNS